MGSVFSPRQTKQPPRKRRPVFMRTKTPQATTKHVRRKEEGVQLRICHYLKKTYPQAVFICDYAAGLNLTDGQRIKMMKMRSDDAMSDINILTPSRGYHGLIIELKEEGVVIYKKDGTLRKSTYRRKYYRNNKLFIKTGDHIAEQAAYLEKMNKKGYLGRFAIGYDKAKALIDWYFMNEQTTLF